MSSITGNNVVSFGGEVVSKTRREGKHSHPSIALINLDVHIDASVKIYESAQKDLKLSETFNVVGRRLPIILNTLQTCKAHLRPIQDSVPADVCEAMEKILEGCDEKARK
jgi:hypothetical protein